MPAYLERGSLAWNQPTGDNGTMNTDGARDRIFTMGLFTWLTIVEQDSDRLTQMGQTALALLREDLERLREDD